jgi:hypothetical protein
MEGSKMKQFLSLALILLLLAGCAPAATPAPQAPVVVTQIVEVTSTPPPSTATPVPTATPTEIVIPVGIIIPEICPQEMAVERSFVDILSETPQLKSWNPTIVVVSVPTEVSGQCLYAVTLFRRDLTTAQSNIEQYSPEIRDSFGFLAGRVFNDGKTYIVPFVWKMDGQVKVREQSDFGQKSPFGGMYVYFYPPK